MGCEAAAMQPAWCRPVTAGLGHAVALMLVAGPVCGHVRELSTHCQLTRNRAAQFLARPPDPGPPSRSPNRGTRHRLGCRAASLSISTVATRWRAPSARPHPTPEATTRSSFVPLAVDFQDR